MRSLRGANARAVIKRLNPIIRGWAAYYRGAVSSETFRALDGHLWRLAFKWAVFSHSTSRSAGLLTGTSVGSISPGATGGCSGWNAPEVMDT